MDDYESIFTGPEIDRRLTDVDELKSALSSVRTDVGTPFISYDTVTGKYIFDHEEKTNASFNHSNPIAVSKGDIAEFTAVGYLNYVAMIALSNAAGTTFTDKVISTDNNVHTYIYTVEADGYIVVSWNKSYEHSLVIKNAYSNTRLKSRIDTLYSANVVQLVTDAMLTVTADNVSATMSDTGHFIDKNAEYSASSAFNMSASISLPKGSMIMFNARGYSDNVAVLARVNANNTYKPLIVSVDSDEHDFTYIAPEAMNVVISTNRNVSPVYSIFSSRIDNNDLRISALENDDVAFATIGVIGDSLASGASNYSNGAADRPNYSWGKYIEREHGIDVNLFTRGGATTREWLSESYGLAALNAANVLDCYVIGLGVNDAYSLGSAYLGTSSDVHVGNESQNADTYYGNYSRIIAAIKTKSSRAKIFCITNPRGTSETGIAYNNAVKTVSAMYTNTFLIDLTTDRFYTSEEFKATWYAGHSTALGYKIIARNLYNHISEIIRTNMSQFLDIQWIVDNHP